MSRPAALWKRRGQSPFIRPKKKAVGGKKLGIDWDRVPQSNNHQLLHQENLEALRNLRLQLIDAERDERRSAANRIRREINLYQESDLALSGSSCGSCCLTLSQCRCQDRTVSKSTVYRRRKKEEAQKVAMKSIIRFALWGES